MASIVALGVISALYVARHSTEIPFFDDWLILIHTVGEFPLNLDWLWSPHNEHRIVLQRLLQWGLDAVFGGTPLAGIWTSFVCLSLATVLFLDTARRLRGGIAVVDITLPLLLWSLGHHRNLIWSFSLGWTSAILIFAVASWAAARASLGRASPWCGVCSLSALALLATGIVGILLAGPLLVLVGWWSIEAWSGGRRVRAALHGIAPIAALAFVVLYFRGLSQIGFAPVPDASQMLRGCVAILGVGFGPSPGIDLLVLGALAGVLALLGVAATLRPLADPETRAVSLAALAILVAGLTLAVGVAWGRCGRSLSWVPAPRYALLAAVSLCTIHLCLARAARDGSRWRYGAVILMVMAATAWFANVPQALRVGERRLQQTRAFLEDVRAGVPVASLARRHYRIIYEDPRGVEAIPHAIRILEKLGLGPFSDPALQLVEEAERHEEVELPLTAIRLRDARLEGDRFIPTGPRPCFLISVDPPREILAVRLQLHYEGVPLRGNTLHTSWWPPDAPGEPPPVPTALPHFLIRKPGRQDLKVWIDAQVAKIEVQPLHDDESRVRIEHISLIVAAGPGPQDR